MITKERGEEEEDDEGDEVREGCDGVGDGELCLTEVVLVVRGRRIMEVYREIKATRW